MRVLMHWIAPTIFQMAYFIFRSRLFRNSPRRHQWLMKIFRFAADNGSRNALSVYGHLLHFRGEGKDNRIQGAIYLEKAAAKGDMKAQYQMGKIYEEGFEHYFQPSYKQALHFYRLAANQGHTLAIKRMRDVYHHGELDMLPDPEEAQRWADKQPALPVL